MVFHNFFSLHHPEQCYQLKQMALLGFFLPPYAAACFEPTSVELHRDQGPLEGLSYSATAMDFHNKN